MTDHKIGTRDEWLVARQQLLKLEKEHTQRGDELAQMRQELPWVKVEKEYRFDTDDGPASLAGLFGGRSQLLVYHFMFGPDFSAGCPSCSAIADGFNGAHVHLQNHDVAFTAVSRAPLAKLQAYKKRLGWSFPWASSFESDFNYDFGAGQTREQQQAGTFEYNYAPLDMRDQLKESEETRNAWIEPMGVGTDYLTFRLEMPGMSAFATQDGDVYHTYSAYARGLDGLWGMYQWLDRAPLGRNEAGMWWKRNDEYGD